MIRRSDIIKCEFDYDNNTIVVNVKLPNGDKKFKSFNMSHFLQGSGCYVDRILKHMNDSLLNEHIRNQLTKHKVI